MSRRTYVWNAFETTLNGAITAGATSLTLNAVTNLRAPGILVIDRENASKREYVKFTGISVNDLTGLSRGLGGSAGGTGQAHDDGASVRCVTAHQTIDDVYSDIEDLEAADVTLDAAITALEAADTAHFGSGGAVHADATVSAAGFMTAADFSKLGGIEPGATGDQSAAEILALLLTVDGDGSGLDADTVDGYHAADLVGTGQVIVETREWGSNVAVTATSYGTTAVSESITIPTEWDAYHMEVSVHGVIQKDGGTPTSEDLDMSLQVENQAGTLTEITEQTNLLANAGTERVGFAIAGYYNAEAIDPDVNPTNFGYLTFKTNAGNTINVRSAYLIVKAWRLKT